MTLMNILGLCLVFGEKTGKEKKKFLVGRAYICSQIFSW